MSDPLRQPDVPTRKQADTPARETGADLFSAPKAETAKRGIVPGTIAALFLAATIGGAVLMRRAPPAGVALNAVLPADPYAGNVSFSQLAMSESTSLSGGKSTFLDGHVRNSGGETLTAVTMQVLFKNDEGLAPSVETLPLSIIRTHQPYVDTEALGAAPLKPGDEVEFRLIFETVPANWNQQMPDLRVVHVAKLAK